MTVVDKSSGFRIALSLVSAVLGTAMAICVFLPWFEVPVMGWTVPSPAWSKAGIAGFVLASVLYLRAIGGFVIRWLVRVSLLPAAYLWWNAIEGVKKWGAEHLGSAQLKLSPVNMALSKLGGNPVTIYEPALWKGLEPAWGWKVTGATFLAVALFTVLDGPRIPKCSGCGEKGRDGDSFCHKCGLALKKSNVCTNCGLESRPGDRFCRGCSRSLSAAPSP